MCTQQRFIRNKYTGKVFLAKCGHCKSCLQEKAALRSSRIRNEAASDSSVHPLFVTLTYDRYSCPFILHDDVLNKVNPLPVYREIITRKKLCDDGNYHDVRVHKRVLLDELIDPDYYPKTKYLPYLKHRNKKVGVCFYPDIQNFLKRLRINLQRNFNYDRKFSSFQCFEYGETTKRPHFHLLLFIPPSDEALFREAILSSWPFADRNRTGQYIELCKNDAAGYVSSYINSGSDFPKFLARNFKPKHSHSKLFGHGLKSFALDKILQKVADGDLQYSTIRNIEGVPSVVHLPIPKYVINKFFPLFKGYSRLTDFEVRDILSNGNDFTKQYLQQGNDTIIINLTQFSKYDKPNFFRLYCNSNYRSTRNLDYSISDLRKIDVRLKNAFKRYHAITGRNLNDYAQDFTSVWNCYKSTRYRLFMEDDSIDWRFKYDNIHEYYDGKVRSLSLDHWFDIKRKVPLTSDPNEFPYVVNSTLKMEKTYNSYLKTKKVNNEVYSQLCDYY